MKVAILAGASKHRIAAAPAGDWDPYESPPSDTPTGIDDTGRAFRSIGSVAQVSLEGHARVTFRDRRLLIDDAAEASRPVET